MAEYREWIRACVYERLMHKNADISPANDDIDKAISELTQAYPDYDEKAKINLEVVVPIKLPPHKKPGYVFEIIKRIKNDLISLGGGAQESLTNGSWLSPDNEIVAENCISLTTSISMKKWKLIIPTLRTIVSDIIQPLLFQQCVFYRLDEIQYGDPVNLMGNLIETYPAPSEFGEKDTMCLEFLRQNPDTKHQHGSPFENLNFSDIRNFSLDELIKHGEELILVGEFRTAQGLFSKAKNKAKIEKNIEQFAVALSGLGNTFHNLGQTADAVLCHQESIQLAVENRISHLIVAGYHNLSLVLLDLGDVELARDLIQEYEDIILNTEELKNNPYGNACYYVLRGFIAEKENDFEQFERYMLKAKEEASILGDERIKSICLHNLASVYFNLSDYDRSEIYLQQSLESKTTREDRFGLAHDYLAYATLEGARENYDQMLEYCRMAYEISREIEADKLIGMSLHSFAVHSFNISHFEEAIEYLSGAINYLKITQSKNELIDSYVLASKIRIKLTEYNLALQFVSNAIEVQLTTSEASQHEGLELLLTRLSDICSNKIAEGDDCDINLSQIAELFSKIGSFQNSAKLYSNHGVVLYNDQSFSEARVMFEKSLDIFKMLGDIENSESVLENINELDEFLSGNESSSK